MVDPSTLTALSSARTLLFVPGDRPDRFAKAVAAHADLVVIDLEDGVAAARKDDARAAVVAWLKSGGRAIVRVNGVRTPWHAVDVAVVGAFASGLMVPKVESEADLSPLRALPTIPLIETARGLLQAPAILATPGVVRAAFGSIDLASELAVDPRDHLALRWARSCLVAASAAARVAAPIDGVTTSIDDPDSLTRDLEEARRLGFSAKLCIHPRQLPTVRSLMGPSADELAWASRIVSQAADGALAIDREMVDAPVLARAQALLDRATQHPDPPPDTREEP